MQKLFIVLHHTADPAQSPQFEKVNRSHRNRGFPESTLGWHVGYHWFIGFDGSVKQARQEEEVGAHCPAKMMNYVGIGVCLAGDFTKNKPNPAQLEALERLVTSIQRRWPIPDDSILLHRECKSTSCPGVDLREALMAFRRARFIPTPPHTPTMKRILSRRLARLIRRGL